MKANISEILSKQVNKELYSAYLYLEFQNIFNERGLQGFAHWYMIQTQEERDHALLFNKYVLNNGAHAALDTIAKPDFVYTDFRMPLATALEHEYMVSARINDIYAAAYELKDFRTMQFLDWFVKEQGEEEQNTDELLKRYDLFGSDPKGLYMLDAELSARVYNPPSLVI